MISPRKRWTRAECERVLPPAFLERVELVDGDLFETVKKNYGHWSSVALVHAWLLAAFGKRRALMEVPIDLRPEDDPTNEPVPDIIVLNRDFSDEFRNGNPRAIDLDLAVEAGDSSVAFDLGAKALLYARAGLRDYWVIDIPKRRIVVHREPREGRYRSVLVYGIDESVAPLAAPDREFPVRQAFE